MVARTDSGASGQLKSLAGILGRPNVGLKIERPDATVTFTTGVELRPANPHRVWLAIQNLGAKCTWCFDSGTGIAPTAELDTADWLVIDDNMPWTGPVYFAAAAGSLTWIEASVQP